MNNFKYITFDKSDYLNLDITPLLVYSAEPIRLSSDKVKYYAKYIGDMPSCLSCLSTRSREYSYNEIQPFLLAENWNSPVPF